MDKYDFSQFSIVLMKHSALAAVFISGKCSHLLALFSALPLVYVQFSFISDSKQQKPVTALQKNGVLKAKRSKGFVPLVVTTWVFLRKQ